ncbi:zinc-binding metallopeptidase family protein [Rufibacter psychrotolerans]|uniref:zinc-binding metallopeptidase family protein n=1 Tax=Rufibacter psychrotolerans TaxID=2812556 RepID=UPI001967B183|nr:putative zinc-binding metallopeptidase [Rufibacter sp. SYSU D00308]
MKTYHCACGNKLFFENSQCLSCQREVGWCPVCKGIHAMEPDGQGGYRCLNSSCQAHVVKCYNYATHHVCNRMVESSGQARSGQTLCDYCQLTETIPDLSVEGNPAKWYKLEVAKRRLLYLLDEIGLPYGSRQEQFELPLSFDFKEDVPPTTLGWLQIGPGEKVYTGHADGKITINVQEADSVEREKLRVQMNEAHRTLIGHFRHEIGHYYWQLLVQGKDEAAYKALFGDHENPTYSAAMQQYYANGPKANWRASYISAYATMHPWEDFAETWGTYLDMVSVLDTADNAELLELPEDDLVDNQFDTMLLRYADLSLKVNEVNRSLGLPDLLPETFSPPVVEKLRYIHNLVARNRKRG